MAQVIALYIDCILRKDYESIHLQQQRDMANQLVVPFQHSEDKPDTQNEYSQKSEQTLVQLFRFLQAKEIFIQ